MASAFRLVVYVHIFSILCTMLTFQFLSIKPAVFVKTLHWLRQSWNTTQYEGMRISPGDKMVDFFLPKLDKSPLGFRSFGERYKSSLQLDWDEDRPPQLPRVPRLSYPKLNRSLSRADYLKIIQLIDLITQVLSAENVTVMMCYGTLLGSYRLHDVLPWDDDGDMLMHKNHANKALSIINSPQNVAAFGMKAIIWRKYIKVWFLDSPSNHKYQWGFPQVDIFLFDYNGTHAWNINGQFKFKLPVETILPMHNRPLGTVWIPAPNNPHAFLRYRYKNYEKICKSHVWNHVLEKSQRKRTTILCSQLRDFYPHVNRTRHQLGVKESLILNGTELYSVIIHEKLP